MDHICRRDNSHHSLEPYTFTYSSCITTPKAAANAWAKGKPTLQTRSIRRRLRWNASEPITLYAPRPSFNHEFEQTRDGVPHTTTTTRGFNLLDGIKCDVMGNNGGYESSVTCSSEMGYKQVFKKHRTDDLHSCFYTAEARYPTSYNLQIFHAEIELWSSPYNSCYL